MTPPITHPNGTHLPVLLKVCARVQGPVLELGCGEWSTPYLHALCAERDRYLLSVDDDFEWIQPFANLRSRRHHFLLAALPLSEPLPCKFGVALLDHNDLGGWRRQTLGALRSLVDVFVVHDVEPTCNKAYNWGDALDGWRHSFTDKACVGGQVRWTTVLSDSASLEFL